MKRLMGAILAAGCAAAVLCWGTPAQADPVPKKYLKSIEKGLAWLAKNQHKDGHWGANGDQYRIAMTSLAGMALLMEGSTIRTGKYSDNIRRATDYLLRNVQKGGEQDGLIADQDAVARSRYMYGQGFATLFLASVYGDEEDKARREKLRDTLTRAVQYIVNAQSSHGAWYYTANNVKRGVDMEEGSVTITQVQALRAARNAGIPVPVEAIKKCQKYLRDCTAPSGAVYYSLRSRTERPAITAAALACAFNAGEYDSEYPKKWLKYCQQTIPYQGGNIGAVRFGHTEYTHYYFAQCIYVLGDDGWERLYGKGTAKNGITWKEYRQALFDYLVSQQQADGSWPSNGGFGSPGPVFSTAVYTTIMQLDKNTLPIYQR